MKIYQPIIKISKDCTMNVARMYNYPYFEWEEVCKAHQFDAMMALIEISKLAQEDGLYD